MLDSISFFRVIKTGFINFWRNIWLSAAATMVMVITLVIFSVLFVLFAVTTFSIKNVQDTVNVSVYFKVGLAETRAKEIQTELEQNPRIANIVYKNPEQVLEDFKIKNIDSPDIVRALDELDENPFPATLNIKAVELQDYEELSELLKTDQYAPFIDTVSYDDNRQLIGTLNTVLKAIVTSGIVLVIIFSLIAILVISNTITLTIYNRKEEVEIMRLVGATNSYIRGPFLVESFMYAFFATAITGGLFWPVFNTLLPRVALFINPQVNVFNVNIFTFWYLCAMLLVISVLLAIFSTLLAIRRYLRI